MSISTLVEFNSFKIFFSLKTQTMMEDTEKIILLTLNLRRRHRKKRNYSCKTLKTSILGARYFYQKNWISSVSAKPNAWSLLWRQQQEFLCLVKTTFLLHRFQRTDQRVFFLSFHFFFFANWVSRKKSMCSKYF